MPPIRARSNFYHQNGEVESIFVDVIDFNQNIKKFIVEFVMPGENTSSIGRRVNKI